MSIIIRLQNLPLEANSLDIRRFFSSLHIPDGGVHIVGGDNGDAFIAFGTDEDARQAMERNGNAIKGSRIKLLLSSRNEMQRVIDAARNQTISIMSTGHQVPANNQLPTSTLAAQPQPTASMLPSQQPSAFNQKPIQYGADPMQQPQPPQQQQQPYPPSMIPNSGPNSGYYPPPTQQQPPFNNNRISDNMNYGGRAPQQVLPPQPGDSYRARSRSRSRSPPRAMAPYDQAAQQQQQQQLKPQQPTSSMHSGLLGSLGPPQLSPFNNNNSGLYPNSSGPRMEQPRRDTAPTFGDGPYNNNGDIRSSAYPPPAAGSDRWNQQQQQPSSSLDYQRNVAPGRSGLTAAGADSDFYRGQKMDSMHQSGNNNSNNNVGPSSYGQAQYGNNVSGAGVGYSPKNSSNNDSQSIIIPPNRLFTLQLYGLPLNVRQDDLRSFFQPLYLHDDNIKIFYDEKGFPTGIALVRFQSPRDFESALNRNNHYLGDRQIQIRPLDELNGPSSHSQTTNTNFPPPQSQQQPLPIQQSPLIAQPPPMSSSSSTVNDPYRNSENYPPYRNTPEDIAAYNRGGGGSSSGSGTFEKTYIPVRTTKECVIYMKGLPYSNCTTKDVAMFFGPIQLQHIEIEMDRGKPNGNAFVELRDQQDFERAMRYNMRHMGRRYIELIPLVLYEKYGPNYHSAPPPPKLRGPPPPFGERSIITHCISIRGLSPQVISKDLKTYFQKHDIETYAVHLMLNGERKCAGEAYVEFINKECQRRALDCNNKYIGCDQVSIRPVSYDTVRKALSSPGVPPPHHRDLGPYGPSGSKANRSGGNRRGGLDGARNSPPPFANRQTILLMKYIPHNANNEDICEFFQDYGITPNRIRRRSLEPGMNAKKDSSQEAQISFRTKDDAYHAQRTLDKKYLLDRRIHLSFL